MMLFKVFLGLAASSMAAALPMSTTLLAERQNSEFPAPSSDPFYSKPSNLGNFALGQPIRARYVSSTRIQNSDNTDKVFQMAYKTSNAVGGADVTVATVFTPKNPVYPRKVLSFQLWDDTVHSECFASWALPSGTASPNTGLISYDAQGLIPGALALGWYVTVPDHLGSASAFMSGFQSGRAVLDGIRATGWILGMNPKQDQAGMHGYSGGAHATAWAAQLAKSYAPDLNLTGAAYGGVATDIRTQLSTLNGTAYSHYNFLSLGGLANAYSDFNATIRGNMSSYGQQGMKQIYDPNTCIFNIPDSLKNTAIETYWANGTNPLNSTVANRVFSTETLLQTSASRRVGAPSIPIYIYQGTADQITPFPAAQQYVNEVCAAGGNVRFVPYSGLDHFSAQGAGANDAAAWMYQTMMQGAPTTKCGASS